jgi:hypothetical protein
MMMMMMMMMMMCVHWKWRLQRRLMSKWMMLMSRQGQKVGVAAKLLSTSVTSSFVNISMKNCDVVKKVCMIKNNKAQVSFFLYDTNG